MFLQVFGGDLFNVRFWICNGLKMIGPQTQCRSQCRVRPFSTAEWHSHDHISTPPGQSQLQICLMNPNIIFVNPQQRISLLWILHVCSQQIKAICQFRTLDNISLRVFWIWTMKLFCWRGETGDSCRVLQVKQALAKTFLPIKNTISWTARCHYVRLWRFENAFAFIEVTNCQEH